jgi:murein DD-endopeptidase MepM/ murein hydrolase activator NlpD
VLLLVLGVGAAILWRGFVYEPPHVALPPPPDLPEVTAPEGSQLLFFPMEESLVTAGYKSTWYLTEHGYPHYAADLWAPGGRDVLSCGNGMVLGTEFCDNSLGNIAVIQYDHVYIPHTGQSVPLIARYYHMAEIYIGKGDMVTAGQVIGMVISSHEWHNHVHIELDTDISYPFHTPQVAEASSELLHRYPADGQSILDPFSVLVLGEEQRASLHKSATWGTEADLPRYVGG